MNAITQRADVGRLADPSERISGAAFDQLSEMLFGLQETIALDPDIPEPVRHRLVQVISEQGLRLVCDLGGVVIA